MSRHQLARAKFLENPWNDLSTMMVKAQPALRRNKKVD
jgi:hypothetical protein